MKKSQTQIPHRPTRNPNPNPKPCRLRLRRNAGGRRSGGPATLLLKWKLEDADLCSGSASESEKGKGRKESTRKLAARIWLVNGGLVFEPTPRSGHLSNPKNDRGPPFLMNFQKNGILHKLGDSAKVPKHSMERATKWDTGFNRHLNFLEDQQVADLSNLSSLRSELEHARARIAELEIEKQSAKKKLDHFVRKLAEEKEVWWRREHEKIRAVIDSIKDDVHREKKTQRRMEIMNSKLVNELAEAKLSAKRFLQDYEKERKTRELMEEVCDELAKEIGDDKAEVEALKADSVRIREEIEEERKMLQMAEVWREERVQMKLVDAKVMLEEKYSQLSKLQSEIEAFLRARSDSDPDEGHKKEAEFFKEAANSVKAQEIAEFSYQHPPASEDIFSVFEELRPKEEPKEKEIEACYGYTNRIVNDCSDKPTKVFANGGVGRNGNIGDDESGWKTVSHVEEQCSSNSIEGCSSSNSIEGSDPPVNGICEESNASVSGTDWDENGDNGKSKSDISEVCSVGTRQSRKKGSSIARFWRSSHQNNGFEYMNGRMYNATLSPDGKSGEVGLSSPSVGNCSSPDTVKPHINRGMKEFIEWPRGVQKHSLKAKLVEARIDRNKIQLRQALKQKI